MTVKEAKVEYLEGKLKIWLNDSPFKKAGIFYSPRHMAVRIVDELELEEIIAFEKQHEADLLTYDGPSTLEVCNEE